MTSVCLHVVNFVNLVGLHLIANKLLQVEGVYHPHFSAGYESRAGSGIRISIHICQLYAVARFGALKLKRYTVLLNSWLRLSSLGSGDCSFFKEFKLALCSCCHWFCLFTFWFTNLDFGRGKIMSRNEDDVKNDSDNDLGDDFDYQPNADDDAEDDDMDLLDSTSKSEEVCGVKRIENLMVEDIWNLEFRTEDEACQFYNAYSCWHEFVMRKDDVVRDNQGRIISRQLVCNKEGWRNMRYFDLDDRSKEARSLTRTKCPARLRVKLDYGCGR
ncbi:hypothetical protein Ahy_A04g019644 [Arachis hypogaea]|uniref:FAR1 domain-containing protein n=2 Tax=Arachis TaxID=3817 RepID=A0A445DGE6_ARAHY|nr:hypothetical protein Ahy_A04g019644 [Arachis hypogaea]